MCSGTGGSFDGASGRCAVGQLKPKKDNEITLFFPKLEIVLCEKALKGLNKHLILQKRVVWEKDRECAAFGSSLYHFAIGIMQLPFVLSDICNNVNKASSWTKYHLFTICYHKTMSPSLTDKHGKEKSEDLVSCPCLQPLILTSADAAFIPWTCIMSAHGSHLVSALRIENKEMCICRGSKVKQYLVSQLGS